MFENLTPPTPLSEADIKKLSLKHYRIRLASLLFGPTLIVILMAITINPSLLGVPANLSIISSILAAHLVLGTISLFLYLFTGYSAFIFSHKAAGPSQLSWISVVSNTHPEIKRYTEEVSALGRAISRDDYSKMFVYYNMLNSLSAAKPSLADDFYLDSVFNTTVKSA